MPTLILIALIAIVLDVPTYVAETLPRRAFLGIQMEPVTADVQRVMKLPSVKGVLIQRVLPGSSAESAGLQRGDVLLSLDDHEVNAPDEAVLLVGSYKSGQRVTYRYIRSGVTYTESTVMQGLPYETYPDLEVLYESVTTKTGVLRTIITKPKDVRGKLPALLFIQGVACYSLDTPFDTLRSEIQLINTIVRQRLVVMRVDKSGMGDSNGIPCSQIDFNEELDGYTRAFAALQQHENVDLSNCFVFGHSMGGVMAPLIAKTYPVKGIIAYGALAFNFMEYFTLTRRTIANAYQMDVAQADDYIKEQSACASMLISAKLSREEAIKRLPACGEVYDFLLDRDQDFWYQLNALNISGLWHDYNGKVLSLWGSTDYITTKQEHEFIASTVNARHPGNAKFVEVPDCDHGMHTASTFHDAINNPGPYHANVGVVVTSWLNNQINATIDQGVEVKKEEVSEVLWMEGVENAYPRGSADGSRILFQSNRSGKWHVYIMDKEGNNVSQITHGDHNNNFPDWSPDNRTVAFVSDRDGNEEIYIMQMDGSGLRRLTNHPARDIHPYVAPDGKSLLFNSSRDNLQSFEIYQIKTDGKNLKRLTETPEVETCARFSPDGKKILYLKGFQDGSDEIQIMDPDGTNQANLTQTPQMEGWPAWSPEGKKIIFSSRRNGNYCLYEMQADGSNVRQISFAPSSMYDARAGYMASNDLVLFNRQTGSTIGIFLLKLNNE